MNMISEFISFGNITLKLNLPEKTAGKNLYADFFCDERVPDYVFNFSFCDCLGKPDNECVSYDFDEFIVEKNENGCRYFYKNRGCHGFYAVRKHVYGSDVIDVRLDRSISGRLWTRIILNTIGIEEIAVRKGGVIFHSSFIEKDGKAVLFTGPCSVGKSTQANLWNINRGTPVINGDKTYLYPDNGAVYASGLPFSGSSGICKNKWMPLDFIVKLEKAENNAVRKLSSADAFFTVLNSCYVPFGLGAQVSEIGGLIAQKSRICCLSCLPDGSAVETLEKYMQKEKNQ